MRGESNLYRTQFYFTHGSQTLIVTTGWEPGDNLAARIEHGKDLAVELNMNEDWVQLVNEQGQTVVITPESVCTSFVVMPHPDNQEPGNAEEQEH